MLRKHLAWILLGLSAALNVAFVGGFVHARYFAEPPPLAGVGPVTPVPMPAIGKAGPVPSPQEVARELGLNEAQMRALRQVLAEQRRRAVPAVREIATQRDALVAELAKEKPDPAVVDRALDRIGQMRTQLQKDNVQAALRFAETLPAEQRDRFRRLMVNRAMGMQPRRQAPAERK